MRTTFKSFWGNVALVGKVKEEVQMLPAFQIHLNQPILERTASVGKFDGKHPSLACGTTAGKVFLHSPNEKNESDSEQNVRYLNINRKVSSLAAGKFKESEKADTLVIGTQTSLLAYNVEKNSDIFYKDVPDGVNTMLFAPVFSKTTSGTSPSQMIVVGGNCSIQGFDREGNELMWNVTGDNVRALAMCDVTGQGRDELIVGSDDFEIKAFQQEDIVFELMETSKIVALCPIQKQLFGYALINGTVGVYKGKHRVWRVKSKNTPITIQAFDINGDGEKELIIGWSNGKFEARRIANGEIVHKDKFGSSIAAIVTADYRMDGNEEVICCSTDGEIRGYFTTPGDFITSVAEEKAQQEEKEVIKLSKLKASLQQELKNIEVLTNTSSSNSNVGGTNSKAKNSALRIPFGTKIQIKPNPTTCSTSTDQLAFQLEVSTENESVIKMVVLQEFDVGIFEGESLVIRPSQPSSRVMVPLNLTKNMTAKLDMKILVGSRGNNTTFHVFEESYTIPKFAMFIQTKAPSSSSSSSHKQQQEPKGSVCFKTPLKTQQMCGWIDSAFTLNSSFPEGSTNIDLYFKSYRDGSPLQISLNSKEVSKYYNTQIPSVTKKQNII
jgi:Bardet-Biedl syndrome 2 protein